MNLLPPPGPERRRLLFLVLVLVVASGFLYWRLSGPPAVAVPTATGPAATSNTAGPRPAAVQTNAAAVPQTPQPLKFPELEQVPAEPKPGRNLFRFGVPPPPPPPPVVEPRFVPTPTPKPTPVGPPPIPLKFLWRVDDPYQAGRVRVYLLDPDTKQVFEAVEGEIVDGKYKLLKVGNTSVVMSYLDGLGQRTIPIGG